jgi:low affinity Fe/Cu permease
MIRSSTKLASAERFRAFACKASIRLGSHWAFLFAVVVVAIWLMTGPLFHFSDTWQLVINTGTTIVTFLMVFLIQATQNRDATAVHLKLDELIRSSKARNIFADLEDATEEEITAFKNEFRKLRRSGADIGEVAAALPEAVRKAR